MIYRLLADLVLVLHFAFVIFAVFGGALVLRYPNMLKVHLLALSWAIVVQWADWVCPLTPLENYLRGLGGGAGYDGSFVEHFVLKILYPQELTPELRTMLGLALIIMNVAVYTFVMAGKRRQAR
jgi:uncharacterized protein DUF2784